MWLFPCVHIRFLIKASRDNGQISESRKVVYLQKYYKEESDSLHRITNAKVPLTLNTMFR